jgi:hypothetical protein
MLTKPDFIVKVLSKVKNKKARLMRAFFWVAKGRIELPTFGL